VFLNFSLPIYSQSFGAGAVGIGGAYTVFTLTMLLVRPLVGQGLDRYGRRGFFSASFLFYALAMFAFQGVDSLAELYFARFLQGLGASFMWVSARTIVADVSPQADRGREMGRLVARSVQGSMVGAFYGFTLLSLLPIERAWSLAFLGYGLLAIVGLGLSLRFKPLVEHSANQVTPLVLTPGLKRFGVILFLTGFATALIEPIYLIFLNDKFDLGIMLLAAAFFPAGLVFAILPPYAGRLSDRYGRTTMIAIGISLSGSVAFLIPWLPSIWLVAICYVGFAVGGALTGPAQDALLSDLAGKTTLGRLTGYKEAAYGTGAALGPLGGGVIYQYINAELTFAVNACLLLITAGLVLFWLKLRDADSETVSLG
jgi:MFS family permease